MDRVLENLSNKILNKISIEEQDYSIVAYGVHQIILIGFNVFTAAFLGILWGEVLFSMLFLFWFIMLRPFAGGYHADTELRCYMLSIVLLNIILACKRYLTFSIIHYLGIWIIAAIIIFVLAPVGNASNLLDDEQIKRYGKNSRIIVIVLSCIMLTGMALKIEIAYSSIVYSLVLVCIALLAGKIKYRSSKGEKEYL